jgi:hypothetical protein
MHLSDDVTAARDGPTLHFLRLWLILLQKSVAGFCEQ